MATESGTDTATHDRPGYRTLPAPSDASQAFWTGGEPGSCGSTAAHSCQRYFHPPVGVCFRCHSRDVGPEAVSGQATVAAVHHLRHPWFDEFPAPYVVAIVELDEDPETRLTTNIVDCPVEDVRIGMPVTVVFEHWDDVWIPVFRPVGQSASAASEHQHCPSSHRRTRSAASRDHRRRAVPVGRRLGRSGLDLAIEACLRRSPTPGSTRRTSTAWPATRDRSCPPGFTGRRPTSCATRSACGPLGAGGVETPRPARHADGPCAAVATGRATTSSPSALSGRATAQAARAAPPRTAQAGGGGAAAPRAPGVPHAVRRPVPGELDRDVRQRYMHEFGLTASSWRRSPSTPAQRRANPKAIYTAPMTMDDYLGARMISDPFCLYDCDIRQRGHRGDRLRRGPAADRADRRWRSRPSARR